MFDLRPLRSAGFRHLATAYWVNEFGNWIGEIALTILVYDRTHSPLGSAALFTVLRCVPASLAPLVATRVESMPVRWVLTTTYVLEAGLFTAIAVLTRHFTLSVVLAMAALDGCLAVTARALTRSATASSLIRDGLLREGNGIMNLGMIVATAASPAIAGVLIASRGPEWALLLDAGTFLATALIIASARGIKIDSDRDSGFLGRLRNGMSVLRTNDEVRSLMVGIALVILIGGVPIPIEVVFVRQTLHAGDSAYGLLLSSWGLGMVLGAAAFAVLRRVSLTQLIAFGTVVAALGYGALALSPTLAVACAASALGGLGNGGAWIAAVTAVQERIPLSSQSAIMALLETLGQVMPALGFVTGGLITAYTSPRAAYGIASLGVLFVVAVIALRSSDRKPHLNPEDMLLPAMESSPNAGESGTSGPSVATPTTLSR